MDKINFDSMRMRIELLFRIIGKLNGRGIDMPIQALNRLVSMVVSDGINVIFIYRYDDKVDLTHEGKKNCDKFAEIVVRHFNNIRNRMMQPAPSLDLQIANLEIFTREGLDTMMIEVKAFFERVEKKDEKESEVTNAD